MQQSGRISEAAAQRHLTRVLKGRHGPITRADAQTLSGLPASTVEQTLTSMLSLYRSHLAATESGELLYVFEPGLVRRDALPLRERLARIGASLWRFFVFAFKIAIVAVLIVYFLIFLALLLGLVFARSAGQRGGRRGSVPGGPIPFWVIWWMLPWNGGSRQPWLGPAWPEARAPRRAPRKKLYQQVFDFVFGPRAPAQDEPGPGDSELLAYIRANNGRLSAAEVVAMRGLTLRQAEEEATRLMCEHDGEPTVSEEGQVIYVFRELRLTAARPAAARSDGGGERRTGSSAVSRWRPAWERLEPRPPLTGNRRGADAAIGAVNGFNLLAALWLIPPYLAGAGLAGTSTEIWLGLFPAVFSTIFFLVPAGRALLRLRREPARRARNRRRLLLRELFGGSVPLADGRRSRLELDVAAAAQAIGRGDSAEEVAVRREAGRLAVDLDADVALERTGPAGGPGDLLLFPRLEAELAAVRRAREAAPAAEADVGPVVFDSSLPLATPLQEREQQPRDSER